jgi:glycosyltransferase involved in cell wall biosynthesis
MTAPFRVSIIHPHVPQYRREFFEGLRSQLLDQSIVLDLYTEPPHGITAARGDGVEIPWAKCLPMRTASIGRRSLRLQGLNSDVWASDLIIVEQALSNMSFWRSLLRRKTRSTSASLAVWGHGSVLTRKANGLEQRTLAWATNQADWFLGYTTGSVTQVVRQGFPAQHAFLVQNAIDTTLLRAPNPQSQSLNSNRFLYLGGIDAPKKIPDLLAAAEIVRRSGRDLHLTVAGSGTESGTIEDLAAKVSWLTFAGPVYDPAKKLELAAESLALVLPGRVGLAVVDAFAMGLPVIATSSAGNAPEFEYLRHNFNSLIADPTSDGIAKAMCAVMDDYGLRDKLAVNSWNCGEVYTMQNMVNNFSSAIQEIRLKISTNARRGASC